MLESETLSLSMRKFLPAEEECGLISSLAVQYVCGVMTVRLQSRQEQSPSFEDTPANGFPPQGLGDGGQNITVSVFCAHILYIAILMYLFSNGLTVMSTEKCYLNGGPQFGSGPGLVPSAHGT